MLQQQLQELLKKNAEPAYQRFAQALLPGTKGILGVRIPKLRKLAQDIAKNKWRQYLEETSLPEQFEETMLRGMVIGYADMEIEDRLLYLTKFVPQIDNWSVCDSVCTTLKFTRQHKKQMWDYLQPYFYSDKEFLVRFAAVMALNFYIEESYMDSMFKIFSKIKVNAYYSDMAIAWTISICFVRYPQKTMEYLKTRDLSVSIYKKALQKICESRQVSADWKKEIRRLRSEI
jgi:3-methyladenine DNA glycosylase AlkD